MDKVMPLFHCDLFIKEDVGTDEQREDLKKQILQAKEDNRGGVGGGNPGCWRSTATYDMDWLYESMRVLSNEANKIILRVIEYLNHYLTTATIETIIYGQT